MSIFDLLSGKKFEKGMVAGAKPFEEKYKQYAEALKRLQDRFGSDWGELKTNLDQVITVQESAERERLYKLNTPFDIIKAMKDHEKKLLLAILYTLAGDKANENQQAYIRSVQKYLGIRNPQTSIEDFSGIENIESLPSQKAILQACMEFLFLAENNTDFFSEYDESLFSHFNLNEKSCLAVWDSVLQIYSATGPQGLAEKYGYVPVVKKATPDKLITGEQTELEKQVIEQVLHIPSGGEITITEKELILTEDIKCDGKLILKDCAIVYNGDNIEGQICLGEKSGLFMSHCTIVGNNNAKRNEEPKKCLVEGKDNTSVLEIENSLFLNCFSFANGVTALLKNSVIRYTKKLRGGGGKSGEYSKFMYEKFGIGKGGEDFGSIDFLMQGHTGYNSVLDNCLVESDEKIMDTYSGHPWLNGIRSVTNCAFKNAAKCLSMAGHFNKTDDVSSISKTHFLNCREIINSAAYEASNISDCLFENCLDVLKIAAHTKLTNCQFIDCGQSIIYGNLGDIDIGHCDFINVKNAENESDYTGNIFLNRWGIGLSMIKEYGIASIHHCSFDGIKHGGFIKYSFDKELSVFSNKIIGLKIHDSDFKHCAAGIIDKQNHKYDYADVAVSISNCTGLDGGEDGIAENPPIRHETSDGSPIGTSLNEDDVGTR
ncbi:hypothetical protein FACS1894147_00630 [Spirochaetia bacterium]|nr:hypothetical protein FACS1894147_00630 [Spirochaetia bacterium]